MRSIQTIFTHRPVSTFDRVSFQLTGELFLYGMALRFHSRPPRRRRDATPIPAETEAMRKTRAVANKALAAGTRALLYGSVAAAAGVVGGGFVASAALDVRSSDDLRALLQRVAGPSVERARRSLAPWREWMEGGDGGGGSGGGGGGGLRWIEESNRVSGTCGGNSGCGDRTRRRVVDERERDGGEEFLSSARYGSLPHSSRASRI